MTKTKTSLNGGKNRPAVKNESTMSGSEGKQGDDDDASQMMTKDAQPWRRNKPVGVRQGGQQ
jgi:hypothetical protein